MVNREIVYDGKTTIRPRCSMFTPKPCLWAAKIFVGDSAFCGIHLTLAQKAIDALVEVLKDYRDEERERRD